jgi:hypothetical protein
MSVGSPPIVPETTGSGNCRPRISYRSAARRVRTFAAPSTDGVAAARRALPPFAAGRDGGLVVLSAPHAVVATAPNRRSSGSERMS